MKKIVLFASLLLSTLVVNAQIPPVSPAACAECGAKNGEPHKSWCPYAPQQEPEAEPEHYSDPVTPPAPKPAAPSASHYTAPATAPATQETKPDFSTLPHPQVQDRPLFSGINEHNLTVAPTELTSHTQWGEVDLKDIGSFTYDICRYTNFNNTAVVLGHTQPNGIVEWMILQKFPYGYYNQNNFIQPKKEGVRIVNIHLEAEGRFIFVDYSDGTNRVFDSWGNMLFVAENNEVRLLNFKDGERYFFEVRDRETSKYLLWTAEQRETELIGISTKEIQYLNNAFITFDYHYNIKDFNGNSLTLNMDGRSIMFFDDVTVCQIDMKPFYIVEVKDWNTSKYTLVSSDLKQYGGWYATTEEMLRHAWGY
ncbi:MAG: hypothetical protein IKN98_03815 [Bacteroidales bacterium]|nr:hypothetical protein [Bacteroidales bacterium]